MSCLNSEGSGEDQQPESWDRAMPTHTQVTALQAPGTAGTSMTRAGVLRKEEHNEKQKHGTLGFLRITERSKETQQHNQPTADRASKKEVLGWTRIRNNIQQLTAAESKSFQAGFKVVRVSKTKDVRQHGESRRQGAKLTNRGTNHGKPLVNRSKEWTARIGCKNKSTKNIKDLGHQLSSSNSSTPS